MAKQPEKMAKRPDLGELAKPDNGIGVSTAVYANLLLDNPDTVLQKRGRDMAIYDELLRDEQVKSTFEQRRNAVVGAETVVNPASESSQDKEAAEFIQEQLDRLDWDGICDKMLYGVFYGYSVAECLWRITSSNIEIEDILVRDRSRFRFDMDKRLRLVNNAHPSGLLLPGMKFWNFSAGASHSDNPYGLGLAHHVYWPVFFKRSDIKFWLIFLEKFGQPTTAAKLPGGKADDPNERQKAMQVLNAIQTDGRVVIPEEMVIELIEAARSGTADYDSLHERMDKAISKAIIGQTMTTDDGSSLSQAKVHADVAGEVKLSDTSLLCSSFNQSVIKWLIDWNFPGAGYPKVCRNVEPEEDLGIIAERFEKISKLGYEPEEQMIEETFGPGWRKKPEPTMPSASGLGPMGPEFSELSELAGLRVRNRADQQALIDAAASLAMRAGDLYGDRVEQLLNYLEETDDVVTFKKRLNDMLADAPKQSTVEAVRNATFVSRLMGVLTGQR